MRSPKVSICIISYNHAAFLPMTIESALAQTYDDFEVVIVDDGSTDGSLAIAESYAQENPNVRVFTHLAHTNKGISATCNLTIEKACGEYILIIGSDDALYPYTVAEQAKFLNEHSTAGAVCGIAQFIDKNGQELNETFGENIWSKSDFLTVMLVSNKISAPTVMVREICYQEVGFYAEKIVNNDWEMWLRLLILSNWKIGFINEYLAKYRIHDTNVSINKTEKINTFRNLQTLQNIEARVLSEKKRISPQIEKILKKQTDLLTLDMFYLCAEEGNMKEANEYLSQYMKRCPRNIFQPRRFVSVIYRTARGILRSIKIPFLQNSPRNQK